MNSQYHSLDEKEISKLMRWNGSEVIKMRFNVSTQSFAIEKFLLGISQNLISKWQYSCT
jgi:hypothetical protein